TEQHVLIFIQRSPYGCLRPWHSLRSKSNMASRRVDKYALTAPRAVVVVIIRRDVFESELLQGR
ncbi:hypothetical protein BgiBS90_033673, partial [Biomphalaria glabrata]